VKVENHVTVELSEIIWYAKMVLIVLNFAMGTSPAATKNQGPKWPEKNFGVSALFMFSPACGQIHPGIFFQLTQSWFKLRFF
jgi:hypothetical protein